MTKILDKEKTWFVSDTHFEHARIMDLSNRPFDDIGHHNVSIMQNLQRIPLDHTLVHCGDVALGQWPRGLDFMKNVQCRKVLLPGNHDRISSLEKQTRRDRFLPDYEAVFDEIWDEQVEIEMDGVPFIVSHYPPAEISDHGSVDRYPHLRPVDDGEHHFIHGHTHQTHSLTRLKSGRLAIHVGVDSSGYKPVRGTEIVDGARMADLTSV
jgi:calcineurin-like phosphoesterase family protein